MSPSLTTLLEEVVNRALRLDPDTLARLGELEGKVVRIRIAGTHPLEIFVLPSASGVGLRAQHDTEAHVTLSGDVSVFAKLALRRVVPGAAADGEVQISGDIPLGQRFQQLLEKIDIDWEEQIARVLGDVAAHQLGNALRRFGGWTRQSLNTLGEDAADYLREESRLLPSRSRVEVFRRAVESLRVESERLESRLNRLRGGVK